MLTLFIKEDSLLREMCDCIKINKTIGLYDGAYNAVKLAMGMKSE